MKKQKITSPRKNKMKYKDTKIGLHCHCEEKEECLINLLEKAKTEQAKYIAITNHRSLRIYSEILPKLPDKILDKYKSISLIPSVEMSANFLYSGFEGKNYGIEVHILGYGIDLRKEELLNAFVNEKYKQLDQNQELQRLVKIGHELGLVFEDEDAYIDVTDGNHRFAGRAFMQAVIKNMDCNFNTENGENENRLPYELRTNWGAFYNRCVKDINSPFYLELSKLNPDVSEVIDLIHQMGGKAYLAHPSSYFSKNGTEEQIQRAYDNVVEFATQFMNKYSQKNNSNCHIDGVELYHPSYLKNMQLLSKMKLLVELHRIGTSGGTDIHIGSIKTNQNSITDDSKGGKIAIKKIRRFSELKKSSKTMYQIRREVLRNRMPEDERE